MIAYLKGVLRHKQPPMLVLDVNGVGYEMEAPMTTFYELPDIGGDVSVHTHMVVREDAQLLYAFSQSAQRNLFRNLLKVNGVGPRVALAILSGMSADDFVACINHNDIALLTRIPGIGRKTAERLIIEMRDRLKPQIGESDFDATTGESPSPVQDAVSALVALGYKPADAGRVVRNLNARELSREELIKQSLQTLAGGVR